MTQQPATLEQTVRVMQIITLAMVLGVVLFTGIVVFLWVSQNVPQNNRGGAIISIFGACFAATAVVLHLVVPSIVVRQKTNGANEDHLYGIYQGKTIIGLALLEGAAFLNLVACILEQQWWSLAIAGGLVFWMLAMFPTRTRVAQWVETQQTLRDVS